MRSIGERIRDLLQELPRGCGLTHSQIALVLELPERQVRNAISMQVHAGVVRPLPGPVRGRRWARTLRPVVDQALRP